MKNNHVDKIRQIGYKSGNQVLLCKCKKCGVLIPMYASHYYRGDNGCKCDNLGVKYPRLYRIWTNIKTRCLNPNSPSYRDYGARGIKVCSEWRSNFEPFLRWALSHGYSDELTIDRIDVNGNYEPNNCRCVYQAEQSRNKRSNINFIYRGEVRCLKEISRLICVNYKTMCSYYYRNGYAATAQKYNLKEVVI